jgi:AbrB family looped-hinge helix DNA binding protein
MNATITIDKAGRLVLPKPVREELQLAAGDDLEIESSPDQIVLRPKRGTATLRKKHGIWVLHAGKPLSAETTDRTLEQIRNERSELAWGLPRSRQDKNRKRR